MRIVIDYQCAYGKPTGIGVFAKTLISGIRKQAPEIKLLCYANSDREDLNTLERMTWESFYIPLKTIFDKPNAIYSPGFASPVFSPVPKVVTVHDLIGVLYPENQGKVSAFYWSQWLPFSLKRAHKLIASSQATKRDMEQILKLSESRIEVVPLGAEDCFRIIKDKKKIESVLSKYKINYSYFITVGTLEPRKNILRLIQAYEVSKLRKANCHLLIVGKSGISEALIKKYIKEKNLNSFVHLLGYIDNEELVCLYNKAIGYITASLYEGFGLPALEAMSSGISGISSLL